MSRDLGVTGVYWAGVKSPDGKLGYNLDMRYWSALYTSWGGGESFPLRCLVNSPVGGGGICVPPELGDTLCLCYNKGMMAQQNACALDFDGAIRRHSSLEVKMDRYGNLDRIEALRTKNTLVEAKSWSEIVVWYNPERIRLDAMQSHEMSKRLRERSRTTQASYHDDCVIIRHNPLLTSSGQIEEAVKYVVETIENATIK